MRHQIAAGVRKELMRRLPDFHDPVASFKAGLDSRPHLVNGSQQLRGPAVANSNPDQSCLRGRSDREMKKVLVLADDDHLVGGVIQSQIDVVTEAAFPKLIEEILEELKTFRDRINGLYPRLLNSALDQERVASQNAAWKMWVPVGQFK